MLICRCAWHPRYRGYPLLSGIASWRGWNVRFTDGICEQCLARFRAEHQRLLRKRAEQKRAEPVSSSARPTQAA